MVIKGNDYQFFVGGELADSFKSQAIPTGRVGLVLGGCAAEYDNIVITGPDVPDVGPSGFAVNSGYKLANTWGTIRRNR